MKRPILDFNESDYFGNLKTGAKIISPLIGRWVLCVRRLITNVEPNPWENRYTGKVG